MYVKKIAAFLFLSFVLLGARAAVEAAVTSLTVTVNRTGDGGDLNPGDGLCDASVNVGEQCSLRAAIEELNAQGPDATPHRIEFDIPGSGPFTITPGSALPAITVPVEIDGVTQPGASCPTSSTPANLMIVLDGINAGVDADGLVLSSGSSGSTVRGLVIGNFDEHGIVINSADNRVRCNHVGLNADGISPMGNNGEGILITGAGNIIGETGTAAFRNVVSANGNAGVYLGGADDTLVINNFVGTTADGLSSLGNEFGGVYVGGDNNEIRRVVIGGKGFPYGPDFGIRINSRENNLILDNDIGVARDGTTPLLDLGIGIEIIGDAFDNIIGGTGAGEANRIANVDGEGVRIATSIAGTPVQNQIRGNAIYASGGLGIDLGGDGVDVNDPGDGDTGENERQNYPVLTSTPGSFIVQGAIDGHPFTSYDVDVYRSESCDPSGYGEGQQYLVTVGVATGGSGEEAFLVDLTGLVSNGNVVTATATDPLGNTSEFSACVTVSAIATATPTATQTNLPPTVTPTTTWTQTPGPSPTWTYTPTSGPSPTLTASSTPGPSPTATWTGTPGPSPTPTLTFTPGSSPTPTVTGSLEPSPTATSPPGAHRVYLPIILK